MRLPLKHILIGSFLGVLALMSGCNNNDDDGGGEPRPVLYQFREVAVVEGFNLRQATGFIGSAEHNAIFVAHREINPNTGFSSERVIRIDLATGAATSRYFDREDYVSKRMHIRDDELIVIGGSFFNTYSIDLQDNLTNVRHGLSITRFGSALYNDQVYIWGGDINELNSDKIYRWNEDAQTFDQIGTLPGPTTWAQGEIVDGRIYIFGGREEFESQAAHDLIYIHDLESGITSTQRLPGPVPRTFTVNGDGVIYVAGQTWDTNPNTEDLDIFFGIYSPGLGLFDEIPTNLSDEGWLSVNAITRIEDKLYFLYGNAVSDNALMSIMEADIP